MNRLKELDDEIEVINKQVYELQNKQKLLLQERIKVFRDTCNHEFKSTMYSDIRDGVWKNEVVCVRCGLIQWEEL